MKRIAAVMLAAGVLATAGVASAGGQAFTTELLGANEVPTLGDPDGSGTAWVSLNRGQGEVCWSIEVEGVATIAAAHIHAGAVGVPGGVVVPLMVDNVFVPTGCIAAERELVKTIAKDPAAYYVNVHNADFMGGALRGQLG